MVKLLFFNWLILDDNTLLMFRTARLELQPHYNTDEKEALSSFNFF